MDFTDAYRLTPSSSSHRPFAYSTGSTFFATLHNLADEDSTVVQVRVSSTLQIVRTWTLDFQAVSISWSKSGALLLIVGRKEWIVLSVDPAAGQRVGSDSRGIVARVVVGMEGLANAMWVGHGNFEAVCVFSADDTLAHIYDIQRHTVLSFANPKRTKAFTSSLSNHVGLLTRQNGKDCLEIITSPSHRYSAEWKAEEHLILHTNDAVEAVWSPNERYIAVREGLLEYKVHIYSPLGHLQAIFQIDSNPISTAPSFQTLYSISTTESAKVAGDGLGIRDMKWSPNGCVLALGGYDENVRILESSEWTMIACLDLSQKLITECRDGAIGPLIGWREPTNWRDETGGRGIVQYEKSRMPFTVLSLQIDMSRPTRSRSGISLMEWNHDGTLLAVRNDNHPAALYILAFPVAEESAIDQRTQPYLFSIIMTSSAVLHATWEPARPNASRDERSTLAFITSQSQSIHFWNHKDHTQMVEAIPIPIDAFYPNDFAYAPDGTKLLITSQNETYCCAIEAQEDSASLQECHL